MTKKYKIIYNSRYIKDLKKVPPKDRHAIKTKICDLQKDPKPVGYKKLHGPTRPPLYRIRVGNYRVVYTIQNEVLTIIIVKLGHRKDIYN